MKTQETYTAVVVNGNQSQLVVLSGILQQDGLQVTSYENVEDALVLMNSQVDEKGPLDVLLPTYTRPDWTDGDSSGCFDPWSIPLSTRHPF